MQKREEISLKFLRVMARLKKPLAFPMQLIVDVGMRSFLVLLEDSGFPSLRSKISHANVIPVKPVESLEANMSSHVGPAPPPPNNRTSTKLHPDSKGKALAFASPSTDISGKHVELGSMLSQSVQCFPTEEVVNAGDRQENSNLVVGDASPEGGNILCTLDPDVASTRSQAVDVPRDRNSCLPIVSLHVATSRPRDMVAPVDDDPGASSRMMIDPIQPCDVEMNAYEIPFPHFSLSSRDLHQDFLPSALPRV